MLSNVICATQGNTIMRAAADERALNESGFGAENRSPVLAMGRGLAAVSTARRGHYPD